MNDSKPPPNAFLSIRYDLLLGLFLVIATLSVYWEVQNHVFVIFDDDLYVTQNLKVRSGLSRENITWALSSGHASNWHPLTWFSHMLDVKLYGLSPGRHHMTNVLFHILNSLLLFIILRRMTGSVWRSGFVAALFALHPLQVESVAWVAQRKTVLSTFWGILTLWSYVRYVEKKGGLRFLATLLFFMLGLLSKPMLVTLPFVLLLLDYWPLDRCRQGMPKNGNHARQWGIQTWLLLEKIPFFALAAASSVATYVVQREWGAVSSLDMIPLKLRIANALVSYIAYIAKMFWPQRLAVFYPYPADMAMWKVGGAAMLVAIISLWVIVSMKRRPYLLVGWLWYLGTLVPVIGLVQVGAQALADRYAYITLIGLFIMIAWGVSEFIARWPHRVRVSSISIGVILAVCIICSKIQVQYWFNGITLFKRAIQVTQNSFRMHDNLGLALVRQGQSDEAYPHFKEALRIKPDYAKSHHNVGTYYLFKGKLNEAITHYNAALQINPDFEKTHNNLGLALVRMGKLEEAIMHFKEALRIRPGFVNANQNLKQALETQETVDAS